VGVEQLDTLFGGAGVGAQRKGATRHGQKAGLEEASSGEGRSGHGVGFEIVIENRRFQISRHHIPNSCEVNPVEAVFSWSGLGGRERKLR
jgi:hypothetical protein